MKTRKDRTLLSGVAVYGFNDIDAGPPFCLSLIIVVNPIIVPNRASRIGRTVAINAFVITLKRAVERKTQVEKICKICPIYCEPLEAVDGATLPAEKRASIVTRHQYWPHYPFQLRAGEIGVFLSHRKAWQEIVSRDLDAGLILEDDIEIDPVVFGHAWKLALERIEPNDYIKFPVPKRRQPAEAMNAPVRIFSPAVTPLGATSQLVTRGAAERLLEITKNFDRPVDTFIQMQWLTGISPRIVSPSGITEVSHLLGGSTIQKKNRPLAESIVRNLKRPTYRIQVVAHSLLHPAVSCCLK